jgi:conjugative relaxase-like TrwC/TraI family protein
MDGEREPFRGAKRAVISVRRMTLGSGYRYLMESVAVGDGGTLSDPTRSSDLTRYYAESGTPPGVFLGAGLAGLDDGRGIEVGSMVTEEHLFNLLGMCADPVTGKSLGRRPNRMQLAAATRDLADTARGPVVSDVSHRAPVRMPVAGFDLTFSPSKSVSVAWALADAETKKLIASCHRQAIAVVLAYAEREVFRSRSGTNGIVQEDIEGVVATAFAHFDSRAGDPQLHDHVVVANRARSVSDGVWRTLDSRGLYKSLVALSELHQGVLSDLLTTSLGWGWDGRSRRHSERQRFEVTGVPEALLAEFSQRSAAIEACKDELIHNFVTVRGRQPTSTEVLELRRRATLETRPDKEHHSLSELTSGWRRRAERFVGDEAASWVAELADRNDLPLLRTSDLSEGILADVAKVALDTVGERRATFSRANVTAEVHRQLHGVRFTSPDQRIAVAEQTTDLALGASLLVSAPELHSTPERLRRADGSSRFRAKGHEIYTTATLLEAEARLLEVGRRTDGPVVTRAIVAATTALELFGHGHRPSLDQALAVEKIATSGRPLDVLIGPAGTGKSTTMAGLRAVWETEYGPGSVLGLAPSAGAAEVLTTELGIDCETSAKWLFEHRRQPERQGKVAALQAQLRVLDPMARQRSSLRAELAKVVQQSALWRLRPDQLVIVDEASLLGTFALDELVLAARDAGAKVLLVGDQGQLSAVEAGGMFGALVADRDGSAPELFDVKRFRHDWEKEASVELRAGSESALDAYETEGRITDGDRQQMLDALYGAWKIDTAAGKRSLMIAGDLATVGELNARARADRVGSGHVEAEGLVLSGDVTAGVGDLVVTRRNDRRLGTGRRWVRNGDQWCVRQIHLDGAMTVQRIGGGGTVVLPPAYVAAHVELAYAATAHRAQGRTVDTAHAMVSPTTTREVLYVATTRGRQGNWLYVDTHYDPDPQTSHDEAAESLTAREVLAGVLLNEGADVTAHQMIRRHLDEAEGLDRLMAEYQTLATLAQTERWDALLSRSGLSNSELETVRASEAHGPLLASFREAEALGLDIEDTFPLIVEARSLADAEDPAAVLHGRVKRWSQVARSRRRGPGDFVAGLVPRARGVVDPEMARALVERDEAMEHRARTLTELALAEGQGWVRILGSPPRDSGQRERWLRAVSAVAAYRDRWQIGAESVLGAAGDMQSIEQRDQRRRAQVAVRRAQEVPAARPPEVGPGADVSFPVQQGIEI